MAMAAAGPTLPGLATSALELGYRLTDRFPDEVYLAETSKVSEDEFVSPTLAGVLHLRSVDLEAGRIEAALADQQFLLIVDNCEQLVGTVAQQIEAILRHGRQTRVLVTSREPVGLDGEQVFRLPLFPRLPSVSETSKRR